MGKFEVYLESGVNLEFGVYYFVFLIKIRQEPKMESIAIFTLVIWCIGVESLPGVREKRQAKGCSSIHYKFPSPKRYQVFYKGSDNGPKWQEAREACQALGGGLAMFSNRQEEDQILAVISKFPTGPKYGNYYIGIEKKHDKAFWISGKKLELDSDLKFKKYSLLGDKSHKGLCGTIDQVGIEDSDCDARHTAGYVCEFASKEFIDTVVDFCQ